MLVRNDFNMRVHFLFIASFLVYFHGASGINLQDLLQRFRQQNNQNKNTAASVPPTTAIPADILNELSSATASTTSPSSKGISVWESLFTTASSLSPSVSTTSKLPTDLSTTSAFNTTASSPVITTVTMFTSPSRVEGGNSDQDSEKCDMGRTVDVFCNDHDAFDNIFGKDSKVSTILHSLFSQEILKELDSCEPGKWCIGSSSLEELWLVDYVFNQTVTQAMCDIEVDVCLEFIANEFSSCDSYDMLTVYRLSVELLCNLKEYNVSKECIRNTLMMLYLTQSDTTKHKQMEDAVEEELDNTCETSDAKMAGEFQCLRQACPESTMDSFYRFRPWQWFVLDLDYLIDNCQFDGTCNLTTSLSTKFGENQDSEMTSLENITPILSTTEFTEEVPVEGEILKDNKHQNIPEDSNRMYMNNIEVVVGVTVSSTIVVMGMMLFVFMYIRRWRTSTRVLDREGYTKLLNEE